MKKTEEQVLNEKLENAAVRAGRFDIFGIINKINKRRENKKRKLCESLGLDVIEPEEFQKDEWNPRLPKRVYNKKKKAKK